MKSSSKIPQSPSKEELCKVHKLASTKREMLSYCSVQHANNKEWFLIMNKYIHLMLQRPHPSFNSQHKEICPFKDNIYLIERDL